MSTKNKCKNTNLNKAKQLKDDEFYTQYKDIEKQMSLYITYNPDVFRDKIVLCPCDDPTWSNFTRYFLLNFKRLGLRKLISTCISPAALSLPHSNLLEPEDAPQPYVELRGKKLVVTGQNIDEINPDDVCFEYLQGSGDYASAEITRLRDESDFIITNPPFSIFRDFFVWCVNSGKKFSIIGNSVGATTVKVFPHIKSGEVSVFGRSKLSFEYNGQEAEINARWFSNIEDGQENEPLELKTMRENLEENPKLTYAHYDNFPDVLEVPYVDAIPSDYDGVMGVPVSFLDKWNMRQFVFVCNSKVDTWIDGNKLFGRLLIRRLS